EKAPAGMRRERTAGVIAIGDGLSPVVVDVIVDKVGKGVAKPHILPPWRHWLNFAQLDGMPALHGHSCIAAAGHAGAVFSHLACTVGCQSSSRRSSVCAESLRCSMSRWAPRTKRSSTRWSRKWLSLL